MLFNLARKMPNAKLYRIKVICKAKGIEENSDDLAGHRECTKDQCCILERSVCVSIWDGIDIEK